MRMRKKKTRCNLYLMDSLNWIIQITVIQPRLMFVILCVELWTFALIWHFYDKLWWIQSKCVLSKSWKFTEWRCLIWPIKNGRIKITAVPWARIVQLFWSLFGLNSGEVDVCMDLTDMIWIWEMVSFKQLKQK